MLIELWLDQPVWLILAALAALFAATGLAIFAVTHGPVVRGRVVALSGVVPPFFGAIAILFALLTGFLANDAWERNRQAARSILAERDALVAIQDLSFAAASDMASVRAASRAYLDAVVNEEWPLMLDGKASAKASAALQELLRELAAPQVTSDVGPIAHATLLDQALRVRAARSDRLAVSEQHTDHPKWWTVLVLACLTQVALALVHLDRAGSQAAALVVFSAAAIVALGLVAAKERPFDGPLAIQPTALREALHAMTTADLSRNVESKRVD